MSSPILNLADLAIDDGQGLGKEVSDLHELAESIVFECKQSRPVSSLQSAIFLLRQVLAQRPRGHVFRRITLSHLAKALLARFSQLGHVEDLQEAFYLTGEALSGVQPPSSLHERDVTIQDIVPIDHEEQLSMTELALDSLTEFQQAFQLSSIESAIHLYQEVLLQPVPDAQQSTFVCGLAEALVMQFYGSRIVQHLDEAISSLQVVAHLQLEPSSQFQCSLFLCFCYLLWYCQTADLDDMLHVAQLFKKLAEEDAVQLLYDGTTMVANFQQTGQVSLLNQAMILLHASLWLLPSSDPNYSLTLCNLAAALKVKFEQMGQLCDLEESISLNREALELRAPPHPSHSSSLSNLADSLMASFVCFGQLDDLDESISLSRKALAMRPIPHPERSRSLNNLANALTARFRHIPRDCDLEESISLNRESLDLRPPSHPGRFTSLNDLAGALMTRFGDTGQLGDLEESISLYRETLDLISSTNPNWPSAVSNLASTLAERFQYLGEPCDLEESISLNRKAVDSISPSHPGRPSSLNSLAGAYQTRFKKTGQLCDLEKSISLSREMVDLLPPSHPERHNSLNMLASGLEARFGQNGQNGDLEESISLYEMASDLLSPSHPGQSGLLNNLATALVGRFEQTGQLCDLEKAISYFRDAISLVPINHPNHLTLSHGLAQTLVRMYNVTGQSSYFSEAMSYFHDAVISASESSPILNRFKAARDWAYHAESQDYPSVLDAYQHAINLLPHMATLGMDLKTRLDILPKANGLACNAARCAIQAGQLEKAVEFLSEGRGVFWTQALHLRTPFDKLQSVSPALAKKLQSISNALEKASHRDSRNLSDPLHKVRSLEQEAACCRILNDDWNHTLDEVRNIVGFEDFLHPKSFHALQQAAKHGPIVLLNASKSGCDGLILTLDNIIHIPFQDLTLEILKQLVDMIKVASSPVGIRLHIFEETGGFLETSGQNPQTLGDISERAGRMASIVRHNPENLFQHVLGQLWLTIVHPVIQVLKLQKSISSSKRLWWCPTGPFAFLPLHAAGIYNGDATKLEDVSDYTISSYTLTLDGMLAPLPHTPDDFKMLTVIQPTIPGQPQLSLPFTCKELSKIEQEVPQQFLIKLGTAEEPTSIEKVLHHLSNVSIAHFACHGVQNLRSPLDSALLLSDGHLKVSKIMQLAMPNASLAYLSACQTAMGDEEIPDEALHIAGTMLFSGFHSVVGTMWSIGDNDAPDVAEAFYAHLFNHGAKMLPDTTEAARALHLAVRKLRAKNVSFRQWVPFIHLGI